MSLADAERLYRAGLVLLGAGSSAEAADCFREALELARRHGRLQPRLRWLSFYGLSRAMAQGPDRESLRACRIAADRDAFDSVLQWNLGRAYLLAGQKTRALTALVRGARLDPRNRRLARDLARIDRRRAPVLSIWGRDHLLNRGLGRLRAALFPRP